MTRKSFDFDLITLSLFLLLMVWGWMTIYANTSAGGHPSPFDMTVPHGKQLIWIGVALLVGSVVLSLDYRFIEAIGYIAYGASIVLLLLTLFVGKEINGAKAWLIIAGQQIQPAEFAKLSTALALAQFMSRLNFSMKNNRDLLLSAALVLVPALIAILQNDTGSALVFGSFLLVFYREGLSALIPLFLILVVVVVMLTLGLQNPWIVTGIILGIGAISFLYFYNRRYWSRMLTLHLLACALFIGFSFSATILVSKLQLHQRNRIMVLFDPSIDPQGAGYNVIQSKIAIGSGGISGKGYLDGNYTKYKFVPKQDTDFIYCTIGEEYGWIGSSLVIIAFFALIWRIQYLAENSKTRFARIYGYSALSILAFHVLINVGMTIGLIPVIGIPLPFFSYGGSALLSFALLIFILINLYSYRISVLGSKS
ncbi:MAG: rod shape-determining protein RodA [Bacteroidetes bacterium]|nr:MAG: rod shape-determining protein RodA [Bacteroidota bacterium]